MIRVRDARTLLRSGRWDAAYYVGGYAIEYALKACIAKKTAEHDFPPERKVVEKIYKHDPKGLLTAAELPQLEADIKHMIERDAERNAAFAASV